MTEHSQLARHVQSRDFEDLREALTGWDHEYDLISTGGFSGDMIVTQPEATQVSRVHWGGSIRCRGTAPTGTFGTGFTLKQSNLGRWLGLETSPDEIVIQKPGHAAEFIGSDDWQALVLAFPEDHFATLFFALSEREAGGLATPHGAVALRPDDAARLRVLAESYFRTASSQPVEARAGSTVSLGFLTRQIERLFVLAIVRAGGEGFRAPDRSRSQRLVRRAEDYVRSVELRPVGITELCQVLDVGERTLHFAFVRHVGIPPATWLRTRRLNQFYKALNALPPERGRVKRVALDHGFTHFGHFTAAYAAQFGERPSETLRRA